MKRLSPYSDATNGEYCAMDIDAVEFGSEWGEDVTPLKSNRTMPIIVRETTTGWRLQDGFGRISGLANAGKTEVYVIIVTAEDIEMRSGANDDQEWIEAMYAKYTNFEAPMSTN